MGPDTGNPLPPASPRDKTSLADIQHELGAKRRWLIWFLGFFIVALAFVFLLSRAGPRPAPPTVTVLANWTSNNERFVTLRLYPTNAEFTYFDLVPDSYDRNSQPKTVHNFGMVFPVREAGEPPCNARVVAFPFPGMRSGLAYTPGSYTIAYSPTNSSYRLRVGAATKQHGTADYLSRLRNCWEQKAVWPLLSRSIGYPTFIILAPATNSPSATQQTGR